MIPQAGHSFLPGQEHPFSYIPEPGVFRHLFVNQGYRLRDRVADGLEQDPLFPGRNAEGSGRKLHQVFAWGPGLLPQKTDARWVVLVARVDTGGEEVIRGRKMSIAPRGIEQSDV